jgi:hypothetical protein
MNANADINAEQPKNALQNALNEINASIFELGETIPEGIYLSMMNNSKKIYDEIKKVKNRSFNFNIMTIEDKARMIKNEDKLYILRRIQRDQVDSFNFGVRFFEKYDLLFPVRDGFTGIYIRLFSSGGSYKFMKITKINSKSIKYDILFITAGHNTKIKKNNTLKFKEGDFYEDLSDYTTKQILIYKTSNMVCHYLINQDYLNWDDAEIDNSLKIWN